jgi:hypothetical protein
MGLGGVCGFKRKNEEAECNVEIEYFSKEEKEEQAKLAAAKGNLRGKFSIFLVLATIRARLNRPAAKEPVVLSRTVTGKWVDDVVTPWGAVKEEQRAPFSKVPGQAFNYAKVQLLMTLEMTITV